MNKENIIYFSAFLFMIMVFAIVSLIRSNNVEFQKTTQVQVLERQLDFAKHRSNYE